MTVSRAAITARGEQQARSECGTVRVEARGEKRDPTACRPRLDQRDRTVDATAHRDGDAVRIAGRADHRTERIRERVERRNSPPTAAASSSDRPRRSAASRAHRVDDAAAVDAQAHQCEVVGPRAESPISSTMRARVLGAHAPGKE